MIVEHVGQPQSQCILSCKEAESLWPLHFFDQTITTAAAAAAAATVDVYLYMLENFCDP